MLQRFIHHATIQDLRAGALLVLRMPAFLRRPVTTEESQQVLAQRLAHRPAIFLELMRRAVFEYPSSANFQLLRYAGCELGDLEKLVHAEGVEGALGKLLHQGVFLTVDELKGRRPIVRGSTTISILSDSLSNPLGRVQFHGKSGGSRGSGTNVPIGLHAIRSISLNRHLALYGRGGLYWTHATWSVPGGATITLLLRYAAMGAPISRWFTQVEPQSPGLHARYLWSIRALRLGSWLGGKPFPAPEFVPFNEAAKIATWMRSVLEKGRIPQLHTFVSSAVRICREAEAAGIDITGAQFTLIGEPFTPAREAVLRRAGVGYVTNYATTECPAIAPGCLASPPGDAVHLMHDLYAVVQPGDHGAVIGLTPKTLLFTTLDPSAPLILINTSMGDQADVDSAQCGCPMTKMGWPIQIRNISSFEKLTVGGMALLDADVARTLEDTLPAKFGGGPTDFQLVEDTAGAEPRLRLLVRPSVGPLDLVKVAETFYETIGKGNGVERIAAEQWRQLNVLRVERAQLLTTPIGKVLHVHQSSPAVEL